MRGIQFFIIILILAAAYLAGDRYGAPEWARGAAGAGFSWAEGLVGKVQAPIPAGNETESDSAAPEDQANGPAPAPSGDVGNAANASLRINNAGLDIIKESEGLRLEAYSAGGRWYIGYGHAGASAGQTITEQQADQLLREDVHGTEDAVRKIVTVTLNENQFSALVSLAYNLGSGGFSKTTVVDALNKGDYSKAADNFRNHNKAGGQVIEHLSQRREKERTLFLTPA
ncbi:MAG: lysozyme [Parvularculaceae bacterium]